MVSPWFQAKTVYKTASIKKTPLQKGLVTLGSAPQKVPKGLAASYISFYGAKFNMIMHLKPRLTPLHVPEELKLLV